VSGARASQENPTSKKKAIKRVRVLVVEIASKRILGFYAKTIGVIKSSLFTIYSSTKGISSHLMTRLLKNKD
jgi:hypothetical protein